MADITTQEALDLILTIPAEKFIAHKFKDGKGNMCVLGHINNHVSGNPLVEDHDLRWKSKKFIREIHLKERDIAYVNNWREKDIYGDREDEPEINGYTEPTIKDRVVHLLKDMVEHGY